MINAYDICAFTETHCSEDAKISIDGYVVKRLTRPKSIKAKRYSGGIAVAIKQNLSSGVEVIKSKSNNIMWVKIKLKGSAKDFLLGVVYISPINSTYTKNILSNQFRTWEILEEELAKFKPLFNVSIVGDFNDRTGMLPV